MKVDITTEANIFFDLCFPQYSRVFLFLVDSLKGLDCLNWGLHVQDFRFRYHGIAWIPSDSAFATVSFKFISTIFHCFYQLIDLRSTVPSSLHKHVRSVPWGRGKRWTENEKREPGKAGSGTRNRESEARNQELESGNEITTDIRTIISKLRMIGGKKDLEGGLRCQLQTAWAVSKVAWRILPPKVYLIKLFFQWHVLQASRDTMFWDVSNLEVKDHWSIWVKVAFQRSSPPQR